MQRYFVDPSNFFDDKAIIVGDDVHHITKVLRYKIGDKVICCDNQGTSVITRIASINSEQIECKTLSIIKDNNEPLIDITLAQALPKSDKMDLIIQKGTEIGVTSFLPFTSERTIVQLNDKKEQKRMERWYKIAKEASEQSHRSIVPKILPIINYEELLNNIDNMFTLIAFEKEKTITLFETLNNNVDIKKVLLVIGPEGGFTDREIELAHFHGAISISLGKRILRTETAGLVGTANILYHFEKYKK